MVKSGEFIFEKIDKFKVPPGLEAFSFGVKGFDSNLKVFFPKDWSHEKIMSKIIEAIKNPNIVKKIGDKVQVVGITSEGVKIRAEINSITGEIVTAFPFIFE